MQLGEAEGEVETEGGEGEEHCASRFVVSWIGLDMFREPEVRKRKARCRVDRRKVVLKRREAR
jgi:hypothetical protein